MIQAACPFSLEEHPHIYPAMSVDVVREEV